MFCYSNLFVLCKNRVSSYLVPLCELCIYIYIAWYHAKCCGARLTSLHGTFSDDVDTDWLPPNKIHFNWCKYCSEIKRKKRKQTPGRVNKQIRAAKYTTMLGPHNKSPRKAMSQWWKLLYYHVHFMAEFYKVGMCYIVYIKRGNRSRTVPPRNFMPQVLWTH